VFSVDLSIRECNGLTVVTLRGELDVADAASVAAALSAAAERARVVIVDLARLEFIDSSGADALAEAARDARQGGKDFLLVAAQPQVLRVLAITAPAAVPSLPAGAG